MGLSAAFYALLNDLVRPHVDEDGGTCGDCSFFIYPHVDEVFTDEVYPHMDEGVWQLPKLKSCIARRAVGRAMADWDRRDLERGKRRRDTLRTCHKCEQPETYITGDRCLNSDCVGILVSLCWRASE